MHKPWRDDPKAFIDYVEEFLGEKPAPYYTLDRADNVGNYEPGNLRWATPQQQIANSRGPKIITHGGVSMNLKQWSLHLGGTENLVGARLRAGWSEELAVSAPLYTHL